jgi:hypothetical protein
MGYEKSGRTEAYPYDELLDGAEHLVQADENQLRSIRYGASRRGLKLATRGLGDGRYIIMAEPRRVEGRGLS